LSKETNPLVLKIMNRIKSDSRENNLLVSSTGREDGKIQVVKILKDL